MGQTGLIVCHGLYMRKIIFMQCYQITGVIGQSFISMLKQFQKPRSVL